MYKVTVERNGNVYHYTCEECGWKDSSILSMVISKKGEHTMRLSLMRNDSIEVKQIEEKSKGG